MNAQSSALGLLIRLLASQLGLQDILAQRVEVITPANSLLQVKEGAQLLRLKLSPYSGSTFHLPPLLLDVAAFSSRAPYLSLIVIAAAADICAAWLLDCIVTTCSRRYQSSCNSGVASIHHFTPLAYLWHPFTILSCVAGSSSTYEGLLIYLGMLGALHRNTPFTAFSIATAAYLGMHPILLVVPMVLLLTYGPEDLSPIHSPTTPPAASTSTTSPPTTQPSSDPTQPEPSSKPPTLPPPHLSALTFAKSIPIQPDPSDPITPKTPRHPIHPPPPPTTANPQPRVTPTALAFLTWLTIWSLALVLLSDLSLRAHPQNMCLLPHLPPAISAHLPLQLQLPAPRPGQAPPGSSCWMRHTYGFLLDVTDHTPNIGFFWYFFQEMFPNFRPFFKFVFHSHALIFLLPLAITLPRRPLLLTLLQLQISAMFKPYPAVGDLALYTSLLPLFSAQLQHSSYLLFLVNSLMLLVVLGPAMWHQWIVVESANANFYYSITLLLGLWQVVLLTHMLALTFKLERGKAAAKDGDGASRELEAAGEAACSKLEAADGVASGTIEAAGVVVNSK